MSNLKAKFDYKAYQKLIYLRDLKDCEVAVLGETKKDDPLHVIDIHLVKQKVTSVAADMDPEDVTRHVEEMGARGIHPINCERFWIHTHPMTGEGSANPSGKDMATWNDPDNSQKNFQVMFIISKSSHVTCKLRVRADSKIAGMPKIEYENNLTFEIVESEEDKAYRVAQLTEIFGEKAVQKLTLQTLMQHAKVEDMYPEIAELKTKYDELVTENKTYYAGNNVNSNYNYGHYAGMGYSGNTRQNTIGYSTSHHSNSFNKKKAEKEDVPELLYRFGAAAVDFNQADYNNTSRLREGYDVSIVELHKLYNEWKATRPVPSWKQFMLGFINVGSTLTKDRCTVLEANEHYKAKFMRISQLTWPEIIAFSQAFNG